MLVALTVWQGRISPLFDATRTVLVVRVEDSKIAGKHYESFEGDTPFSRVSKLENLGVDILICGGISDDFAKLIEARGIQIIPFISGQVKKVLSTYMAGRL